MAVDYHWLWPQKFWLELVLMASCFETRWWFVENLHSISEIFFFSLDSWMNFQCSYLTDHAYGIKYSFFVLPILSVHDVCIHTQCILWIFLAFNRNVITIILITPLAYYRILYNWKGNRKGISIYKYTCKHYSLY